MSCPLTPYSCPTEGLWRGRRWAHLLWMAWLPLHCGPFYPSRHLSPGSICTGSGPAPNAPKQSTRGSRACPEVSGGRSGHAEGRVEPSRVCYHVPAWVPPQTCAWARTLSGNRLQIKHQNVKSWLASDVILSFSVTSPSYFSLGVGLHCQRFIWTHSKSERQD